MAAYKTVIVKGDPTRVEHVSTAAAVTPGNLMILNSSGLVLRHNVAGGTAEKMFAVEDELQGKTLTTDYANSTPIFCAIFKSGDEVFAKITGTPAVGALLSSAGDGTLKAAAIDSAGIHNEEYVIAIALEAATGGYQLVRII